MTKIWIGCVALLVLSGCGGGDKNNAPTTTGATATLNEDAGATSIAITAADPDNDTLTLSVATQPTRGAVAVVDSTHFTYTPAANQNGSDQFTYTVRDPKGLSASGTVSITITPQPDAPVAPDATLATNEDVVGTVNVTATDADGDALAVSITTPPAHGAVAVSGTDPFAFTYTPDANANGPDSFVYRVQDPSGLSDLGTVTVAVAAQPDPPVATNASIATNEDVAGAVTVTATDVDGDALTASVATPPAHGAVVITGTNPFTLTYTPTPNANGADTFTYRVQDPSGAFALGTVNVAVAPQPDAPVIAAFNLVTAEDTQASGSFAATDADGDAVTVAVITPPGHGSLQVTGTSYIYSPVADYNGSDSFSIRASDGTLQSAITQVPVTVTPVNDLPVAVADAAAVAAVGPTDIDVLANDSDVDGDTLTVSIVSQPAGATAVVAGNKVRVTPAAGAAGPTELTYRVSDPGNGQATAKVRIVMGDAAPLYYTASGTSGKRTYRYDFLGAPTLLDMPLPAGTTLERFVISKNGARMVYVSRDGAAHHRLWLKNLDDLAAPVTEISTPAGFFTNYLELSPDGSLVAFNDKYAATAAPTASSFIDAGNTIEKRTFTTNSDKLYYTVLISGGGRIIKRADVDVSGALVNRTQMTASYASAEGLGSDFVLTPDETKIVSTGLFLPNPPIPTSGIKQYAYATTANGSQDDTRLHPPYVHVTDFTSLPVVAANSRYAHIAYRVNATDHVGWADLQAPGTITGDVTPSGTVGLQRLAGDSQHAFVRMFESTSQVWRLVENVATPALSLFNPVGGGVAAPRDVAPAPDGSAVVFDGGDGVYATLGNQFTSATLLFTRPVSAFPTILYAPDSGSVAIAGAGESGLYVVNPKAPGWSDTLSTIPDAPGALCMAYPGEGC